MKIDEVINHEELKSGELQWKINQKSKSISNFIEKNCSEILDIYWKEQKYLYRGLDIKNSKLVLLGKSNDERLPKDTPVNVQIAIDKRLSEAGFTALRGNSIFCTPNLYTAQAYAVPISNVFVIFPINGFSFTYNSFALDLYTYYGLKGQLDRTDQISNFMRELNDDNISSKIFCSRYGFMNTDLGYGISKLREIYINGKYIALKIRSKLFDQVMEMATKARVHIDQDGVVSGE